MAFKIGSSTTACPEDPEALLRDLRKRTIPGPLAHQADVIRSYLKVHTEYPDVALQLPTGSGKTLVGLLIGEWRRRKYEERVVYLCPTRQLVHQVVQQATTKYGMDLHAFVGSRAKYDPKAVADWRNGEAMAVTAYSSLFNTNPFFSDPHLIILDDAHSAENYISAFWSLLVERTNAEHEATFSALAGLISDLLPAADRTRLSAPPRTAEEQTWVEKLPTPVFQKAVPEIIALLDEHTQANELKHPWKILRDSLHACHLYLSRRAILIRPLIPPSNSHAPFLNAKQRIYMSATLGAGGDLERVTGRYPIHRISVPKGWDRQGIGRRFFLFPRRSLDDQQAEAFTMESIKAAGRALYLVPDDRSAERVREMITKSIGVPVFDATQIETSKAPFVESEKAVAVVANRYDGIDLVDDDCRLLLVDGLPGGANLQERFLVHRVTAQLLLDDRILTRLVQGFGRCTRSPNDYAAVVVLGESLNNYLFGRERRVFFHPEIQAELEFGLKQSRETTAAEMLENLHHFAKQDLAWGKADDDIVALRSGMVQKTLPATTDLAGAVGDEVAYQYALWNGDFATALERCRAVIGKLAHADLRGYRALWLYLAGSAAWLAHQAGHLKDGEIAKDYFRKAQAAAPILRWLVGLQASPVATPASISAPDPRLLALVERLEGVLEMLGTTHDRRYDAEESRILQAILQNEDGVLFEKGHEALGNLLGYNAGKSSAEAAPDPWWLVDDMLCFVFEDHAAGKDSTVFSVQKARQAASHPDWIRSELNLPAEAEIVPVLLTPCTETTKGAIPHLKKVRYWALDQFRAWAKTALQTIRELRRDFPGPGDLGWRTKAAEKLKSTAIGPLQLQLLLNRSAADAMSVTSGVEEA